MPAEGIGRDYLFGERRTPERARELASSMVFARRVGVVMKDREHDVDVFGMRRGGAVCGLCRVKRNALALTRRAGRQTVKAEELRARGQRKDIVSCIMEMSVVLGSPDEVRATHLKRLAQTPSLMSEDPRLSINHEANVDRIMVTGTQGGESDTSIYSTYLASSQRSLILPTE